MRTSERVTYATLAAGQTEGFVRAFDASVEKARASFGGDYSHWIDGSMVGSAGTFEDRSPADTRVLLGRFPVGTPEHVDLAVRGARRAQPEWSRRPWTERAAILRRAAVLIEERGFGLSALVSLEVGKNRLEAMGDVTETADLVRYYFDQMEANDGFDRPMARFSPQEETRSVLRPYGVWAVISPFNFPAALAGGPVGAALLAGNTVVLKPSHEAPLTGSPFIVSSSRPESPNARSNSYTARESPRERPSRRTPASTACSSPGRRPWECRSSSRVYVHRSVQDRFTSLLVEKTAALTIGDPSRQGVFLGR